MYGDIILEKNPANYKEAIKTFAELPSTMGDEESGYSKSSPVKMQLTPISEVQSIINRPGVAGAVLHTALCFIN